MSKVKIQGNASGTGVLTVTAPNTSTDRTITLPDGDVTLGAATPSIDDNGDATAITIDSSERVGLGTASPDSNSKLHIYNGASGQSAATNNTEVVIENSSTTGISFLTPNNASSGLWFADPESNASGRFYYTHSDNSLNVFTDGTQRLKIDGDGLKFGTDTAAANALDDYEEGTWTPTISGTNSCSMGTIYANSYTKVGNKVTLYASFLVTSSASPATGALVFGGFPFAFKSFTDGMFLLGIHYNYRETPMAFMNANGNTYYQNTTVGGNNLGDLTAGLDANNNFTLNFTYLTDA